MRRPNILAVWLQSGLGSIRALACANRRPAGRNGRVTQSMTGELFGCISVVGEGADHGTRGRVRSPLQRPICGFAFSVLAILNVAGWINAAEPSRTGREIYQQSCARCHGPNGEGVKDKHAEALRGDWSIAKLARVIAKTMPEDDPGTCVGPEAEAVSRYITDAFYSREAQARHHPARVELVRLTNRQYIHAIADLIKHFTGKDAPATDGSGLQGAYFDSRNNRRSDALFERVDPEVNFEFGSVNPDWALGTTNGFSIQWRGSLLADETGEHDLSLKTPNGARLWVNDEDEPLIDASVASGEMTEHKAHLRLLGGRAYPFRLEYFKAPKDKTAAIGLHWKPPHGVVEVIPARNLSTNRTTPTAVVSTPFPPDDSSVGYERGVSISKAWDEATTRAAIEIAGQVVRRLDRLSHSKPDDSDRVQKLQAFGRDFVETAFRRPLTREQSDTFVTSQFKNAPRGEDAVKRVVLLALKSPRFLYLGLDAANPDAHTIAERLSFALWDSIPDAELTKLATAGKLRGRDTVSGQARRMLDDPRARSKMQYFLHHWLQMNQVDDLSKDAALFPGFTPEIISDLRTSLNLFLADAVWGGASDYRELLQADYLYLNGRLAKFYGVETGDGDTFRKVRLDPAQRSGVLTHPYLLAAFSYPKSTSPIHRGVFLTRNIVGRTLKPPPMAVAFKDADFSPHLTMREKVTELTRAQACQTCHAVINPLGFSLEWYDAVGRFRNIENGRPIDATSEFTMDDGETIRLRGARDVAELAARSELAQSAFIEQLFNHVVKQSMFAYDPELMRHLRDSFAGFEFNLQKLLVEMATTAALHGTEKMTAVQ